MRATRNPSPNRPSTRPSTRPTGRAALVLAGVIAFALVAPASAGLYTIRVGDTMGAIARQHGVSLQALADANGISDPNRIIAGRTLSIPRAASALPTVPTSTTSEYVIRTGDTLSGIARRFGVSMRALADANTITDVHRIRAGARLLIPASDLTASPSAPPPGAGIDASRLPERLRSSPDRLALIPVFERWAAEYGVPLDLLMAMTWLESGWQNHVVSHAGAMGIGQLMPATVDFVSDVLLRTRLDPGVVDDNIRMSARYLRWLLDRTEGNVTHALAGYYQGLASVRARGVLQVSHRYVASVTSLRERSFVLR